MKTIKFIPLRKVKSINKIVVASYMQWRKVMVANHSEFNLVLYDIHKEINDSDFVFNHKGEQLFFYDFNPYDIPIYYSSIIIDNKVIDFLLNHKEFPIKTPYVISRIDAPDTYNCRGVDCDGVPTFSHYTANYIVTHCTDINEFVPLTVEIVIKWYGWFLWQLNNSKLIKG